MVVRNGSLTLIDYDGMYVPSMPLGNGNELGHTHFQHPGRTADHFGPRIDDFSFIMIDLTLDAIAQDPTLYERYCSGDNILFQRADYENPKKSPLFQELRKMRPLARKADDFAKICKRPIKKVPSLEAFLARHGKPGRAAAVVQTPPEVLAGARPEGMSNLDYIRSSLGNGPADPAPGRSHSPPTDGAGNRTSSWLWWVEIFVVVMMLTLIMSMIMTKF